MRVLNLLLVTISILFQPVLGDGGIGPGAKGVQVDPVSCKAHKDTLDSMVTVASEYVRAAIAASLRPTEDPYFYFFKPEQNQTVIGVYTRILRALSGEGPLIPIYCRDLDPIKGFQCDADNDGITPGAWAVNEPFEIAYLNFCGSTISDYDVVPNRCNLPGTPFFTNQMEVWPEKNTEWLEYPSLTDYLIHELSHVHLIVDNDFGTKDLDPLMEKPPYNAHTPVWASHAIAHRNMTVTHPELGRNLEATDIPTNYEYMSKEAWRRVQELQNTGSAARKRMCYSQRRGSATKQTASEGIRTSESSRDELRKLRRLHGLGPY